MLNQNPDNLRHLEAVLDFYLASGVDSVLDDGPVDWFERTNLQTIQRTQAAQVSAPAGIPVQNRATEPRQAAIPVASVPPQAPNNQASQTAVIPDREVISSAREIAANAKSLDELRSYLETFDGCNLKLTAKKLVFADGNVNAKLMLIGEAPGRDEDIQGKPFVGRSGQLLDQMLAAIGYDRTSTYIANVVPWRPPGNRTPTPQETEICKPFIQRQIELVNPDVVVFLGAASAKTLLGVQDGIRKMRGRWMTYSVNGRDIAALATYHPAYLLRSPLEKRLSWRDCLNVKSRLSGS
ncbi:MAG: uracil-DNA glycosylase family protein [Roseibium sp.]